MLLRAVTLGLVRAALVYLLSRPGKSETQNLGVKRKWVHEDREEGLCSCISLKIIIFALKCSCTELFSSGFLLDYVIFLSK